MYDEILETVINQLAKVKNMDSASLSAETCIKEDLDCTSLEIAHLADFLEGEFDVDLPYMKFVKNKTIGDIVQFIEEAM